MFATSDSQREFFSTIQEMLTDQNSAYYRMMEDIVFHVDTEHLISFGMNLGYRSCVSGARTIQENENRLGCNIPWTVVLQLSGSAAQRIEDYKKAIREGVSLGVHSWMLFAQEDAETAFSLAQLVSAWMPLRYPSARACSQKKQALQTWRNVVFGSVDFRH